MSKSDYSNFFANLAKKPYIRGSPAFDTDSVHVLAFDLGEGVHALFDGCHRAETIPSQNMTRTMWQCGDVAVQDIQHVADSEAAREELEIVSSGKREWAKPMRESGCISYNLFGRLYGRDDVEFSTSPHVVISNNGGAVPVDTSSRLFTAMPESIKPMRSYLKQLYINRHQAAREAELKKTAYMEGYSACERWQKSNSDRVNLRDREKLVKQLRATQLDLDRSQRELLEKFGQHYESLDQCRRELAQVKKERKEALDALRDHKVLYGNCIANLDQCLGANGRNLDELATLQKNQAVAFDEAYARGLAESQ